MERIFTQEQAIGLAKSMTRATCNVTDGRLRQPHDRKLRDYARAMFTVNGGYAYCTDRELNRAFPGAIHIKEGAAESEKRVWGVDFNNLSHCHKISFVAIQ